MPLYRHLAASATTDTTNAANISSGILAAARGGAGAINAILKANGSGVVSAAAANTDYTQPGGTAVSSLGNKTLTSTSEVMVGFGATFTPSASGRVLVLIAGGIQNSTANDGVEFHARYGTGTAPLNGAAATGTAVGSLMPYFQASTGNQQLGYCCPAIITALSIGTPYWFDLSALVITGGTATWANNTFYILEF